MSRRVFSVLTVFISSLSCFLPCQMHAFAHPHVFIENHVTVIFDNEGLAGFQLRWKFDEMTSSIFIMDFDSNRDGTIDRKEEQILKTQAFESMRNYHYMTSVSIDNKEFKVQYVQDFYSLVEGGILSYNFFVPCHVKAISTDKEIRISVYDSDFFIEYTLNKDVHIHPTSSIAYRFKIEKNLNKSYYFEQLHPTEIIINFKKK